MWRAPASTPACGTRKTPRSARCATPATRGWWCPPSLRTWASSSSRPIRRTGSIAVSRATTASTASSPLARPERRAELGLLALVLLGAAALRVWRFDLAQVGYDESLVASLLEDWRLHGLFPLTAGIVSNTDFRHPPVWTYLMGLT